MTDSYYNDVCKNNITFRQFIEEAISQDPSILDEPLLGFGMRSDGKHVVRYGRDKEIFIDKHNENYKKWLDKFVR